MKKRIAAALLALALGLSLALPAAAERELSFETGLAEELKTLGLFRGVSDTDLDLDREPTRTEALVMLLRVLGLEDEALAGSWRHPFTDVAAWADKYIGYAYQQGLTNGVSATEFGTGAAGAEMYLTFMLRALGYSDRNDEDFSWSSPYALAGSVGILPEGVGEGIFLRADVVTVSYAALGAKLKDSEQTLAQKLIASGVFTQEQLDAVYDASALEGYVPAEEPEAGSAEKAAAQYELYYLLKDTVLESYNAECEYSVGIGAERVLRSGTGYTELEYFYSGSLSLYCEFYDSEGRAASRLILDPVETIYKLEMYFDLPGSGECEATGEVKAAEFGEQSSVELSDLGLDSKTQSQAEKLAYAMCDLTLLELSELLAGLGDGSYSLEDFGFADYSYSG